MSFFSLMANAGSTAGTAATTATGTATAAKVAAAPAAAQPGAMGGLAGMVPFFLIIGAFIFLMYRSQKKQQQQRQAMIDKLVKGAQVVLAGGIHGSIVEVKDQTCRVEIAPGTVIEVSKNGIGGEVGSEPAQK